MLGIPKPPKRTKTRRGHLFSRKTVEAIYKRDGGYCVIPQCVSQGETAHHVYWHASERIHDFEEANKTDKGVWICGYHHRRIHDGDKALDDYCHAYLERLKEGGN